MCIVSTRGHADIASVIFHGRGGFTAFSMVSFKVDVNFFILIILMPEIGVRHSFLAIL